MTSNAIYRADQQLKTRHLGNGITETRVYHLDGTLKEQYLGGADTRFYTYDLNGNLTGLQNLAASASFGYDALDRLTADPNPDTFGYDPNGNRLTQTRGASTTSYSYPTTPASNRLTGVGGQPYQVNAVGSLEHDGSRQYAYANSGRLRMALAGATLKGYSRYAATGLRLQHYTPAAGWRAYHYAPDGKLLAETTDQGVLIRAYLWDDTAPIAQIDRHPATGQETLIYLHPDHLGTPRLATDGQGRGVWRWAGRAFGDTLPDEDVDGDGVRATVNLRFPGQYFDQETGLHYNWHRYYDPKLGRYITSDPVGLEGGLNTFAYANLNPLLFVDPDGLLGRCGMPGAKCTPPPKSPDGFKYHGNWCGPGWTGGHWSTWDDLTPAQKEALAPAIDSLDSACKDHDICYSRCRRNFRCDKAERAECMTLCDRDLASSARRIGKRGPLYYWMEYNPLPDPGKNPEDCCSK